MSPSAPSSYSRSTTPNRTGGGNIVNIDEAIARNESQARLEERRENIIAQVREFAHITFEKLGAASRQETESLLKGVEYMKLDENEITGWEQFCKERLTAMRESAQKLYSEQFMDPLLAELGKTISARVIKDLDNKFKDENVDYKEKERYIHFTLPVRIKEWRALKERRDTLKKNPLFASLTTSLVPRLEDFRKEEKFIDLKYPDRKGLADQVEGAMNALKKNQEKQYEDIHAELTSYVRDEEIMHASKVGTWLKRIFDGKRTPEEIKAYMKEVVRPFTHNWREAMYGSEKYKGFMELEKVMKKNGIPRGFPRKTKNEFLLMSYKQKTSYLSLAWIRMDDPDGSLDENKELAGLKLRIRHHLDTEDWEGAEADLQKAMTMAPDDAEFLSMQRYLADHRTRQEQPEKQEKPNLHKVLDETRAIVSSLPGPIQMLYQRALCEGPAVFFRMTQVIGGRSWLRRYAGWNDQIERERLAMQRARGQQGKGYLLDLEQDGTDEVLRQIRDHADINAGKTPPQLSSDEHWGYWSSVIAPIPAHKQEEVKLNYHYILKRNLRILNENNCVYTMSGSLTRNDGTIVPHMN